MQRKLFSESPDRFGLVQFGVEGAANPLEYPRVALMERGLAVADWQVGSFEYNRNKSERKIMTSEMS